MCELVLHGLPTDAFWRMRYRDFLRILEDLKRRRDDQQLAELKAKSQAAVRGR